MMQSSSQARSSLARSTLIKMGVRIAVIIALATLFSYLHLLHTLRTESLVHLDRYVSERSEREQGIFVLAEDNHRFLQKAMEERLRALGQEDPRERFDSLFVRLPDGTVRNRAEGFDGTTMPGVIVPRDVSIDADMRRRLLASYDVLARYGPVFQMRFTNTFITLPEGPLVLFWPERPSWCLEADSSFTTVTLEFFPLSLPEHNPSRQTAWSGVYADPLARSWMVTVTTPLDMDGRHVATLSHDLLLADLVDRTVNNHLADAYNLIFRDDGQLIAHPELKMLEGDSTIYNILSEAGQEEVWTSGVEPARQRAQLRSIFEQVEHRPNGQTVLEHPEYDEYLAVGRLRGPGWNFVTVLPESTVTLPAFFAARYVLLFGVLSLLLELVIMFRVLRQQITRPLLAFIQATDRVTSGAFKMELDTSRGDELGRLSLAFQQMSDQVQRREEALRQANEGLEQRVEERTRELRNIQQQLLLTAREAGRSEVATNVLHNVGNVLNSVYTSAQLAQERLGGLRLAQVGRVVDLLEEHQADLATFLTRDERGRNMLPFLRRLGQNLQDERQEIFSLLGEVGRYTEHIGEIVKLQQSYARAPRLNERVDLAELVEDSLRINADALQRHHVEVERHLASLPPVLTDKNKVLMILVNLISNAKNALESVPPEERRLTVRLEPPAEGCIRIEVSDNGVGIEPEMLTRIFQYGFTTRDEGHGFGLHSSSLAAQELGGTLEVRSEGKGRGATFTLSLPCHPA